MTQVVQKRKDDRGAVVVVTIGLQANEFVLVLDPTKPLPHYWKFPGGGIEEEDVDPTHPLDDRLTADNAAKREVKGETGLTVRVLRLAQIHKRTHTLHTYLGLAEDLSSLAAFGDEGEFVKTFPPESIAALPNFHPGHKTILQMALDKLRE